MTRSGWLLLVLYAAAGMVASYFCAFAHHCNNFAIYRSAFANIGAGRNLYGQHPGAHWDLFKYSPTFALLMAPFAMLPFVASMVLWDVANALVLFAAIYLLFDGKQRVIALALVLIGFALSTDGSQVNPLLAGLVILAFVALERNDVGRDTIAALAIGVATVTKIFPIAAATMVLRRRSALRFSCILAVTLVVLIALPLAVTSGGALLQQYRWWYGILNHDVRATGVSLLETLSWLGYRRNNVYPELFGLGVLLAPLLLVREPWDATRRRLFLASVLLYVVLFNPQAERPTFSFALTGIAIWFVSAPRNTARTMLLAATGVVLPMAMVADISEGALGTWKHVPLQALVACCASIWIVIQLDMLRLSTRWAAIDLVRDSTEVGSASPA
ncbi:MAG TPA: glycosyltransferase family 87 protein [Gemmatimonadaceae bacterium]